MLSHVLKPFSHGLELISHVLMKFSHGLELISHVLRPSPHVLELFSHDSNPLSHVLKHLPSHQNHVIGIFGPCQKSSNYKGGLQSTENHQQKSILNCALDDNTGQPAMLDVRRVLE